MEFFEDNKEIFNLLFQSISEGIVVVNSSQIIVSTNTSADEMFGYNHGELVGKSLNILIPLNYRPDHLGHVESYSKSSSRRRMGESRNLYGLTKSGSQFPLEAGLNPFTFGGKRYVMALVVDITDRKINEKKIKDLNESLERKVEERTEQLNNSISNLKDEILKRTEAEDKLKTALEREKELNELKTKFLSLVSHEFKTPLTGIATSATLIGKYNLTEQQNKREKHLNTIKNKVKYLDNILNEFLSLERIDSGKINYNFKTVSLQRVYDTVCSEVEILLKKGQRLECITDISNLYIEFDEKIIELLLFNIINNAVKYSPENTPITIEVKKYTEELEINISDQGMGIPFEEQKFIFNRYFRAQNALTSQGTGIGLNILKSHLEKLGGSLSFESEEHKGSTFTIVLKTNVSVRN